ncbi:ACER, partial [Symbiodinium sp. CCMP2456]
MVPRDPFYRRPIEVLSLHPDPFWGLPTSIVDWCEANYAHTPYVAEFFNTLTAVPMVAVSVWGLYLCVRYGLELRFYLCWAGIGAVGVGTLAFHAMLHPVGQATDELAMICASMVFLYVVLEADHLEAKRSWLPALQTAYAFGFAVAYFTSPFFFPFFVAAYGCTVLLIIFQAYQVYKLYAAEDTAAAKWQRLLFWVAATFYPAAFLFLWVPENA